jgi:hypothetical protein
MAKKEQSMYTRTDNKDILLSFAYDNSHFKSYVFEQIKLKNYSEFSLLFPFSGSLFFPKISDFFAFKTNNKFDLFYFFENKTFDFIIFNHVFNRSFFFNIISSCFKLNKTDSFFSPIMNHYEFFHTAETFVSSVNFFSRNHFIRVPSLYVNPEKDIMFFFDFFYAFFYKLEKILH